jgi:hypothetical protein
MLSYTAARRNSTEHIKTLKSLYEHPRNIALACRVHALILSRRKLSLSALNAQFVLYPDHLVFS